MENVSESVKNQFMKMFREDIVQKLETIYTKKQENSKYSSEISDLQIKIKNNNADITALITDDVKRYISEKLQEAIDKFDLNNGKEDKLYNENVYTFSSSDGVTEKRVYKTVNSNGKFNPFVDEWSITKIDINEEGLMKITVENIKGRKFVVYDAYEPSLYYTDWFDFKNI